MHIVQADGGAWPDFGVLGAAAAAPRTNAELKQQVADTERAFAATMKARDHAAFASFLSDEAVLLGTEAAAAREGGGSDRAGSAFYDKPEAPFSWEPDEVEVLARGRWHSAPGRSTTRRAS